MYTCIKWTRYYFVYTYFWVSLRYFNWLLFCQYLFWGKFPRYFNWYIISSDTHLGKFRCREPGIPPLVFNHAAQTMTGGVSYNGIPWVLTIVCAINIDKCTIYIINIYY